MKATTKKVLTLALSCLLAWLCLENMAWAQTASDWVDYADAVQLDMSTNTCKQEVSVKTFIDGDTTHFTVPQSVVDTGVLKARYLAINTPESTGKIEEYGKKASDFTRERLSAATSIVIESDTDTWNLDSTSTRYLVWVWYKTADMAEYRNLNIEILQNGLAIANSSAQNRYGEVCMAAIAQARAHRLNVYSGQRDPDFYYGDAVELTLKELRLHPQQYNGIKVAFEGVITMNHNNGVFVEDYDPETGLYYGMSVYYVFGLSGAGLDVLTVGNRARIVGTMQYYEAGGTWQVSGLTYRMMKPNDPGNIQKISQGHAPAYAAIDADTLMNGVLIVESDEGAQTYAYADLLQATSVEVRELTVQSVSTGENENAMVTLLCQAGDTQVYVRTVAAGLAADANQLVGKTIAVRGIVGVYDGMCQINVFVADGIAIE